MFVLQSHFHWIVTEKKTQFQKAFAFLCWTYIIIISVIGFLSNKITHFNMSPCAPSSRELFTTFWHLSDEPFNQTIASRLNYNGNKWEPAVKQCNGNKVPSRNKQPNLNRDMLWGVLWLTSANKAIKGVCTELHVQKLQTCSIIFLYCFWWLGLLSFKGIEQWAS